MSSSTFESSNVTENEKNEIPRQPLPNQDRHGFGDDGHGCS